MEFRLIYKGRLPAEGRGKSRAKDKHRIRCDVHQQLRELWKAHPYLNQLLEPTVQGLRMKHVNSPTIPTFEDIFEPARYGPSVANHLAEQFEYQGFQFLPLVGGVFPQIKTACALDILFLRRDEPGKLIASGGDIDNRIKVLLDALKMPKKGDAFSPASGPAEDEKPFFCLLEDDSLISELRVATDRLLTPLKEDENHTDVHLIIRCRTILVSAGPGAEGGASAAFST